MDAKTKKPKVYVVLGPTATGKSDYAVTLALKVDGEVISADSRQVYRDMDIGSGKITKEEMLDIPHHLLDVADPNDDFSAQDFKKLAEEKIEEILRRGRVPIICGGTGFFIQAVVENLSFPEVPPNPSLRAKLEAMSTEELYHELLLKDIARAYEVDQHNKRRLIRALEIYDALGEIPPLKKGEPKYDFEMIGLDLPDDVLRVRIAMRLEKRLALGMVEEVQQLHEGGVSWERLESFGLEYRYVAEFLQGKISEEEMEELVETKSWQFAKRQRTWFKRDKRIRWIDPRD